MRRLVKPIAGSRLLDRRNGLRRKVKLVGDPQLPATIKSSVAMVPRKALTSALAAVGGLVGLTAGSAAVSARRRRSEESSNDS